MAKSCARGRAKNSSQVSSRLRKWDSGDKSEVIMLRIPSIQMLSSLLICRGSHVTLNPGKGQPLRNPNPGEPRSSTGTISHAAPYPEIYIAIYLTITTSLVPLKAPIRSGADLMCFNVPYRHKVNPYNGQGVGALYHDFSFSSTRLHDSRSRYV